MLEIVYDGLEPLEVVSLANMVQAGKTIGEINSVFPGRAVEVEEALAEPPVTLAVMFSATDSTDKDDILRQINELLAENDLPGDADYVDIVVEEEGEAEA